MKKVVIIGAGPAGITTAYELLKKNNEDYSVTILEESDAIGGISRTVRYKGNRMDLGGHRFFSKDQRVTQWWQEVMPMQGAPAKDDIITGRNVKLAEQGPDPEKEDIVLLSRRRISRIYYRKKFFDYPVKMNVNTVKNMGFATTMQAGFSYLGATVHKLPETSLENFYINRFGRKLYSMFFESYTEKLWGRHPRDISADWGAQRVKGLSILAILRDMIGKLRPSNGNRKVETSLIEEFYYPKMGPGQLWENTADHIRNMGGTILMNSSVKKVKTEGSKVTGVTYVEDGVEKTMDADIVISSMPICDLIAGMSDVPDDVKRVAAGLPYRDFVTVGLLVDKLQLKNETDLKTVSNIIPDCWIYVQDAGVKLGRIQIFNNWSPYLVEDPINTVWIGLEYFCREGDEYWTMSEQQWIDMATKELVGMGVISDASAVRDAHQEFVKKAYPAYFDTYNEMDKVVDFVNATENLYCIGRNGQHRYNNMDHSMVTAFETVDIILNDKKDKSPIWNVNTDKEYHEEKK